MEKMNILEKLMDDRIRENTHRFYAPCSDEKFLAEYLVADPDFWPVMLEHTRWEDWDTEDVCIGWDSVNGSHAWSNLTSEAIALTSTEHLLINEVFEMELDIEETGHIVEALIEARLKEEGNE